MDIVSRKNFVVTLVLFILACCTPIDKSGMRSVPFQRTPINISHINQINDLFRARGIVDGSVALDKNGRAELKGSYTDEKEVDLAFSLAQSMVGVRWVSPVTPEDIRVKEWEKCLERIFARRPCGPTPPPLPDQETLPRPGSIGRKYALVVGVSTFKNLPERSRLEYASKDAQDFYRYLVDPRGGDFPPGNVVLLQNQSATRKSIQSALDELRDKAREDDLVLLYFSSHGTPPDKFGGVHIVTYDTEVNPRERVWETAIDEKILRKFIQGVRARRLLVILDACYSNGAYAQIPGFLPAGAKALGLEEDEGHGQSRKYMGKRLLGAKDVILVDEPSSGTPSPEADGWGKVLISASDAGERSWESDQLHNSIFTYFLIDGLKKHDGAIQQAFGYARPLVNSRVKKEKGVDIEQNPQAASSRSRWNIHIVTPGKGL